MAKERERAVADQVHRRLVTGDEEEDARGEQLLLAQLVARLLRGDEAGQHVGPRLGAAPRDEIAEVVGELVASGEAPLGHLGVRRQPDGVEPPRDVEPPRLEPLAVLERHAEHLADDGDGQGVGEVLDEVHPALVLDAVEQAVDDLLDVGAQDVHHARGEGLADEAAQARVVGGIAIEHRQARPRHGKAEARGHEGGDGLLGEARIAERRDDVLVAGEDPEAERALVNGVLGAQAAVGRIGIRDERGVHGIEAQVIHVAILRGWSRVTIPGSTERSQLALRREAVAPASGNGHNGPHESAA